MFQLYYTLNTNLQSTDLKKTEKEEILDKISKMDQDSLNAVFLLIYEHFRASNDVNDIYQIPFEGHETNNGIEFNLAKLPIKLRRILYKFIKLGEKI